MKYKLIALDLDGTLKNSQNQISPRTKEALLKAQEQGCRIVLSSGRPTPGLYQDAKELQLAKYQGFLLSYNGACVSSVSNEIIYKQELDQQLATQIIEEAKRLKLVTNTYNTQEILCESKEAKYVNVEANLTSMPIQQVNDLSKNLPSPLFKLLLSEEPEYVASVVNELASKYQDNLAIYRSAPFFIEVVSKGIDKGNSLKQLCKHLNITADELISFGDGYNDCSMLEVSGCGVAMANAVDEVKAVANHVTLSNDEDGIAVFLEKLL